MCPRGWPVGMRRTALLGCGCASLPCTARTPAALADQRALTRSITLKARRVLGPGRAAGDLNVLRIHLWGVQVCKLLHVTDPWGLWKHNFKLVTARRYLVFPEDTQGDSIHLVFQDLRLPATGCGPSLGQPPQLHGFSRLPQQSNQTG